MRPIGIPTPQLSVAILARFYKTRTVQASRPPYQLRMLCACRGCRACTFYQESGYCVQNIGKREKTGKPLGEQMCFYCAEIRDQVEAGESGAGSSQGNGIGKGIGKGSSEVVEELEERVGVVEAQMQALQPSLPEVLAQLRDLRGAVERLRTLVESIQQRQDGLSQRIAEMENW